MKGVGLCPHCNEKLKILVKEIKKTTSPNTNQWNEEQDKTQRNWSCLNCGFFGSQTNYKNKRKKRNNGHKYRTG